MTAVVFAEVPEVDGGGRLQAGPFATRGAARQWADEYVGGYPEGAASAEVEWFAGSPPRSADGVPQPFGGAYFGGARAACGPDDRDPWGRGPRCSY